MAETLEKRGNCGRPIGRLETAHVFKGEAVCHDCKNRLESQAAEANLIKRREETAAARSQADLDAVQFFAEEARKLGVDVRRDNPKRQAIQEGPALCPSCGSPDIQKASVVWAHGTSSGSATSLGIVGGELGGAVTQSTNQTLLARQAAPPTRPEALLILGVCSIFFGAVVLAFIVWAYDPREDGQWGPRIIAGAIFGLAPVGLGAFLLKLQHQQDKKHAAALAAWDFRWVCLRCGTQFTKGVSERI